MIILRVAESLPNKLKKSELNSSICFFSFLFLLSNQFISFASSNTISNESLPNENIFGDNLNESYYGGVEPIKPFEVGELTIFGSGCPEDSIELIHSPNGQTISVLFSEFGAEASMDKPLSRKSCNVGVPIQAQEGKSIGIFRVDYRGYTFIPERLNSDEPYSYTTFTTEYFFAGDFGYKTMETFDDPGFDDDFMVSMNITEEEIVWCDCGASTIFRINSSIVASNGGSTEEVEITIDSSDVTLMNGFKFFFTIRDC